MRTISCRLVWGLSTDRTWVSNFIIRFFFPVDLQFCIYTLLVWIQKKRCFFLQQYVPFRVIINNMQETPLWECVVSFSISESLPPLLLRLVLRDTFDRLLKNQMQNRIIIYKSFQTGTCDYIERMNSKITYLLCAPGRMYVFYGNKTSAQFLNFSSSVTSLDTLKTHILSSAC